MSLVHHRKRPRSIGLTDTMLRRKALAVTWWDRWSDLKLGAVTDIGVPETLSEKVEHVVLVIFRTGELV